MEIIWGIELNELLLLFKQIGLAIIGATSLWGFVFSIRDIRKGQPKKWVVDDWLSMKIFNLFLGGVILSVVSYIISLPIHRSFAHEGIAVPATISEITAASPLLNILYVFLLLITLIMLFLREKKKEQFSYAITPFYAITFILAFVMTSFFAWRGIFDSIQMFHFMHGFHSIFTLGSVIVLDFLFLISYRSSLLKQHIYTLFPTISKVIWVGLSLDFISVFLIPDYFMATEKFLFMQTVISILIINGVFLSGPIARRMIDSIKDGGYSITARWRRVVSVCGALSITSWITITSLDFFKNLTLHYGELFLVYLSFFLLAFIAHLVFEHIEAQKVPLTLNSEEI